MTGKKDLRIIKTERAIHSALVELLKEKDLEKITVSELSARAEINKATFYLHYTDIYSLYQEVMAKHIREIISERGLLDNMLSDPEEFARRLISDFFNTEVMSKDTFFRNPNLIYNRTISYHICNVFTEQVISSRMLPDTRENVLKLEFFLTGVAFLRQNHSDDENELIVKILADSIRNLFM